MEEDFTFSLFNEGEKEIIRQAGYQVVFPTGSHLFVAGDPADRVYLVDKGWLKIFRVSRDGRQVTVGSLRGEGELMGLAEALAGGCRSCYASPVTDVIAHVISRESFLELMDTEPFLAVKVTKLLAGRMRNAEKRIQQIATQPVSHRLVHTLLYMARVCGTPGEDGFKLAVDITHEELASMVGSSRQTVTSVLAKFKKQGSIITDNGRIKIVDPGNLESVIN